MYRKETEFGLIEVIEGVLYIDGVSQGSKDSKYLKRILEILDDKKHPDDTILMLGGGSFLLPKELEKREILCHTVEQNQHLIDIAKSKFKYDPVGRVDCKDFKTFLGSQLRFSYVIVDIFKGSITKGVYDNLKEIHALAIKGTIINWICPLPLQLLGPCRKLGDTGYVSWKCENGLYQEVYEIKKQ